MTSVVDICNLALLRIGTRSTITSLSDGSTEANACALLYPVFLDQLFNSYDWKFARVRATPTSQASTRSEWQFEYPYPTDCIQLRNVLVTQDAEPEILPGQQFANRVQYETGYSAAGGGMQVIWTNVAGIQIDYTSDAIAIDAWLNSFLSAFTWGLAVELCLTITSNGQLQERLQAVYTSQLARAQEDDTVQEQVATNAVAPWVDVCNQALIMLGYMKTIRSATDGTVESAACVQMYPIVVNEVFGLHDWRFARTRVALAAAASTASTQWAYEYPTPADMVRARKLIDPSRLPTQYLPDRQLFDCSEAFATGWSQATSAPALWSNLNPAILEYTSNLIPVASWPPALQTAVAARLAAMLAIPIMKDGKLADLMQRQYEPLVDQARVMDGTQEDVSANYVPDWIQVRSYPECWE